MIDSKTVVAIIPVRGGLQGISLKNASPVASMPLCAHVASAGLASSIVDRVVVSTDDLVIAAAARRLGAEVIDFPAAIDKTKGAGEAWLISALERIKDRLNLDPEILVHLADNAPLIAVDDIDGTINALIREKADTALAVTQVRDALWKFKSGEAVGVGIDDEKLFLEAGTVYAMTVAGLKSSGQRIFGKTALHETARAHAFKVDGPEDLPIAEALLRSRRQADRLAMLPATIGALVFDFDGVFTDNRVFVNQDGVETVACDRSDGWGLTRLKRLGVPTLVLSTEKNPVVRARTNKLGLTCLQGVDHKWSTLQAWLAEQGVDPMTVTYVGNDVNDLECLQNVGCGVAPADAYPEAKSAARIILEAQGGRGAVRELVELVLARLGKSDEIRGG